jgi:hypothetical protein
MRPEAEASGYPICGGPEERGAARRPAMEGYAFCEPALADDEAIGEDGAPGFVAVSGRVMPTVISKMGPERVRRRTVPRTSPMREAMSPGL